MPVHIELPRSRVPLRKSAQLEDTEDTLVIG
ncbi:MAG: hypothetical protein JWN85_4138, partial [Gammaproteobacteria bacterium]|nr:hypothetical protein [Gammaproteobacteria bacterium]